MGFESAARQTVARTRHDYVAGARPGPDPRRQSAGQRTENREGRSRRRGPADIRLLGEDLKYVSRGGLKLEEALRHWQIDVVGKVCLDVGTSTGGFTDCLLQRGAARVIAVDTGHGQIDFRLRQDARVRLLEKTNARYLSPEQVGEAVDLVVMDVSFISATLVLPGGDRSGLS